MSQHVMNIGGREYKAEVKELTSERALVVVDGKEYHVELANVGRRVVPASEARTSHAPAAAAPVVSAASSPAPKRSVVAAGDGAIIAPMPGSIFQMKTQEGATVQAGQVLLVMEAMKMENPMPAPFSGTVTKVFVREGDNVGEGDLLVEIARPQMTTM